MMNNIYISVCFVRMIFFVDSTQKKKRRPRPPGGDFFDLAELFKLASLGGKTSQRKKSSKPKDNEKRRPPDLSFLFGPPIRKRPPKDQKPSPRPTPPANFDNQNNPQVKGFFSDASSIFTRNITIIFFVMHSIPLINYIFSFLEINPNWNTLGRPILCHSIHTHSP